MFFAYDDRSAQRPRRSTSAVPICCQPPEVDRRDGTWFEDDDEARDSCVFYMYADGLRHFRFPLKQLPLAVVFDFIQSPATLSTTTCLRNPVKTGGSFRRREAYANFLSLFCRARQQRHFFENGVRSLYLRKASRGNHLGASVFLLGRRKTADCSKIAVRSCASSSRHPRRSRRSVTRIKKIARTTPISPPRFGSSKGSS